MDGSLRRRRDLKGKRVGCGSSSPMGLTPYLSRLRSSKVGRPCSDLFGAENFLSNVYRSFDRFTCSYVRTLSVSKGEPGSICDSFAAPRFIIMNSPDIWSPSKRSLTCFNSQVALLWRIRTTVGCLDPRVSLAILIELW